MQSHSPILPRGGICTPHRKYRFLTRCAARVCHPARGRRSAGFRFVAACRPKCNFLGGSPDRYQPALSSSGLRSRWLAPKTRTLGSYRATPHKPQCRERHSFCIQGNVRCSSAISCAAISDTAVSLIHRQRRILERPSRERPLLWRVRMKRFSLCANPSLERRIVRRMNTGNAIEHPRPLHCHLGREHATLRMFFRIDRQVLDFSQ